jgi:hypothetical protein
MISTRRTEFAPFILDLLDFMEEKIREAVADEASRAGAVSEATGVVPLLRDGLCENEVAQGQFMLLFDGQLYEPHATQWWTEFVRMDRAEFEKQAADLVKPHGVLAMQRAVAAAGAETPSRP